VFLELFLYFNNETKPLRLDSVFEDTWFVKKSVLDGYKELCIARAAGNKPTIDIICKFGASRLITQWKLHEFIISLGMIDSICERFSAIRVSIELSDIVFNFLKPSEIIPLPKKTRKLGSAFRNLYPTDNYDDGNVDYQEKKKEFLTVR
jgi:hypothetical protein